jgi:serine/threonine-protein kinase
MLINRTIPPSVSAAIIKGLELDTEKRTETIGGFINGLFEAAPVSVPDTTNEILIKKPPRLSEIDAMPASRERRIRKHQKKKTTSNAAAITVCVMLGLVLIAFITVIVMSSRNPEMFDEWLNRGKNNDDTTTITGGTVDTTGNDTGAVTGGDDVETPPAQSNEPLFVVRDYSGENFNRVRSGAASTFLIFNDEHEYNDYFDAGVIFEQSIEPDELVANGTNITVKVSKGPRNVPLPDYTGMTFDAYTTLLDSLRIKFNSSPEYHQEIPIDHVIRCSVGIRDMVSVADSQTVTVYVSLGPDPFYGLD